MSTIPPYTCTHNSLPPLPPHPHPPTHTHTHTPIPPPTHPPTHPQAFAKEIELTSKFHGCGRVVRLLGACCSDPRRMALIMELAEGGNLAQRIHARWGGRGLVVWCCPVLLSCERDPSNCCGG
jgi:hypothetical protein